MHVSEARDAGPLYAARDSSLLAFHARNVPSITIHGYLARILKYCPATNEVFLSLLVYFDRMTRFASRGAGPAPAPFGMAEARAPRRTRSHSVGSSAAAAAAAAAAAPPVFAIDSYNVHRLVIAGITAASKFFSDIFYTNSRYAKVGGLPLGELNHLELQFLVMNDFRLMIPLEELQRYGDQLLRFWKAECSQCTVPLAMPSPRACSSGGGDATSALASQQAQQQEGLEKLSRPQEPRAHEQHEEHER